MEARLGTEAHHFYSLNPADLRAVGKSSMEWSMNDWKWDGDLFFASPLNAVATSRVGRQFLPIGAGIPIAPGNSSNSSSSCSDEVNLGTEKGKRELEKKRRVIVVEDDNLDEEARNLTLKLGGHGFPISEREVGNGEGSSGKKTKLVSNTLGRAICQVEDCGADLSNAKDYHRRHKVCEMHSKATKALVGSVMQRFCQQCSRFHVLQEFDEGKRSCRRRLAGHNKRRRKTNPEIAANANSSNDDQTNANRSDQTADQDLLSHLLRSLASRGVENGARNMSGLQRSQDAPNGGPSNAHSDLVSALFSNVRGAPEPFKQHLSASVAGMQEQGLCAHGTKDSSAARTRMNSFDLNDAYIDSDDGVDDTEKSPVLANPGISSLDCPSWIQQDSHQSSPPQTSGNSESASAQSPSSSSGDGQSRTDRIVFKLFGKEPGDFPLVLRSQILDWLAHSPTDIESYIRPGCVVLTVYLRQAVAAWEELCCDLSFSLSRLLDCSEDDFWRNGWVYIRAQHQIAFVYNGQVLVDTSLPVRSDHYTRIVCVRPIATPSTDKANFSVKGINLCRPATKLLCAVEGKYLLEEATHDLMDSIDNAKEHVEIQSINFSCSIPHIYGRGFIEIEDHGFSSTFFPFIVAEEEVCSEIRMLESVLESTEVDADDIQTGRFEVRSQAMDFIHEIGWLLHRCQVKTRLGPLNPCTDLFPLRRFKSLMEFSMDHEWCATVKKLLNILLEGTVGSGEHPNLKVALVEMGLLHRAVRKNSRPLVEMLLMFAPHNLSEIFGSEGTDVAHRNNYLFRPDAVGPAGLTPLHIAAGKDDSEEVLDALLDDPQKVGVEAWKSAHDSTGSTPEDYARLRGHYSYIHLVQRKITRKPTSGHVVVDIPGAPSDNSTKQKEHTATAASSFDIVRPNLRSGQLGCKVCDQKLAYRYGPPSRSLVYRPAMLSMVAIAAVCVCVALLFKSCPEVVYMFRPFRWEMLKYGTI